MKKTILTLPSLTYAIKAKKALLRIGIQSELVKVDGKKTTRGCTHGISLSDTSYYDAVLELRNLGIEYAVYPDKA